MSLNEKLQRIDALKAKIDAFGEFPVEIKKKIDYKFRLDWNYFSNRMEGGTLTREETRSVMVGVLTISEKPIKDVQEMQGHDKVVEEMMRIGKDEKRISKKRIQDIHRMIMFGEKQEDIEQIGTWKKKANKIINYKGEENVFTLPNDVEAEMQNLLEVLNADLDKIHSEKKEAQHPVLLAADFHINYIFIHPFFDGNGRTARIFSNLILISCGFPPYVIKDEEKETYARYLADIHGYGGDRNLFYGFIADRVIRSMELVVDALEGKEIEEPGFG